MAGWGVRTLGSNANTLSLDLSLWIGPIETTATHIHAYLMKTIQRPTVAHRLVMLVYAMHVRDACVGPQPIGSPTVLNS